MVVAADKFALTNLTVGNCLGSLDIKGHSVGKGHQVACLSSPFALGDGHYLDKATLKVSWVDLDKSAIILVLVLDSDSRIAGGIDEGVFMIILQNFEDLTGRAKVVIEHDFLAAILHTKCFLLIKNTDNFIRRGGCGCKE